MGSGVQEHRAREQNHQRSCHAETQSQQDQSSVKDPGECHPRSGAMRPRQSDTIGGSVSCRGLIRRDSGKKRRWFGTWFLEKSHENDVRDALRGI